MVNALISVLVVSGVGAFLAVLLVFAERVIANYGEVEIDVNSGKKNLKVKGGMPLLSALTAEKLFIPSACGGRGTCGYCKVRVKEGAGPLLPTEEPYLDQKERAEGIRLSCQVKLRNSVKIEIPEELFSIKEYTAVCEKIKDYTYDMKEFRLKLEDPLSIDYKPGQYVQFLAPRYKGSPEEVYRAYSISSDPIDKSVIELIVRRVPGGICTTYMFDFFKQGDKVRINGPYGEFYLRDSKAPMVFIAGGSGIAPIKCLLHQIKNEKIKRKGIFFFGVRSLKDLFLLEEMRGFENTIPDFRFVPALSEPEEQDKWALARGRITDVVKDYLAKESDAAQYEAYLCGSPGMIDAAIEVLKSFGISEAKIYFDKFS